MTQSDKIPRIPYRRQLYYGENGEVFRNISGEFGLRLAQFYGPSTDEIHSMLLGIRQRQNWSQAALAAVLGIPKHTLRRWEDSSRRPCSSAKKLIWLVHALIFEPNSLLKDLDCLVTWGKAGREELLMIEEEDTLSSSPGGVSIATETSPTLE